jgi:hypothetical protein
VLALSCAAASCGGQVAEDPSDAVADATAETVELPGVCVRAFFPGDKGIECAVGGACVWDTMNGMPACRFDTIASPPCGSIRCGSGCTCSSERVCSCSGAVEGPLPPPDLPTV